MKTRQSPGTGLPPMPAPIRKYFFLLAVTLLFQVGMPAQTDSLAGFDRAGAIKHASFATGDAQKKAILKASERQYIRQKFFSRAPAIPAKTSTASERLLANCDNINFENKSTSGWFVEGDHELVSGGNDPFGGFPKVFPGGKYSLKLNNNTITNKTNFQAKASRLFQVSLGNTFINLHFAMVILNFPHDSMSAARFRISLRDSSSHLTLCPEFNCYYEASQGPIGASNFSTSAVQGINTANESFDVTCASWQTVGIDLSAYMGKIVSLEISCDWCIYHVDWAYCYIDADCGGALLTQIPCFQSKLSGPPGFTNYKWLGPPGTAVASTSPTLLIQSPGIYTLQCNQAKNCNERPFVYLYNVPKKLDASFRIVSHPCNLAVALEAVVNSNDLTYTWKWQDSLPYTGAATVSHVYQVPGRHFVELEVRSKSGCVNTSLGTVTLTAPVSVTAKVMDPPRMLYGPDDVKRYKAFTKYSFGTLNYKWTGENFYVQGLEAGMGEDGLYILEGVDPETGCRDTALIDVTLAGWIPNIFTPNNDGVNDRFRFRTKKGMVLEVFDRWENKVHESQDEKGIISWDGKNQDRECADGTFVYVLRPFNEKPEERGVAGYVTLLR